MREREELLNKIEKVPLSVEKGKVKKTPSNELVEEFETELEVLSPLKDETVEKLSKQKKKVIIKKGILRE